MDKKSSKAEKMRFLDRLLIAIAIGLVLFGSAILLLTTVATKGWQIALCWVTFGVSMAVALVLLLIGLILESKVGYFRCEKCGHEYRPNGWKVALSLHNGADRRLKCPQCKQRSWNKKIWKDKTN